MAAARKSSSHRRVEAVVPAAARTVQSLRDVGYETSQAIADLVDNCIEARATQVRIDLRFSGAESWIRIADNGRGMDAPTLTEALRYGSERDYDDDDLGKFGFGLKSASTSQCRRVTVASRQAPKRARIEVRALDLDHIVETNRWEILVVDPSDRDEELTSPLMESTGTVVMWEELDRILDYKDPFGQWARRKMLELAEEIDNHLGMVFHRFLAGEVRGRKLKIWVNGTPVEPWDPFCRNERATLQLDETDIKITSDEGAGIMHVVPYVLPHQTEFSSPEAWSRASGPLKWNRQQGFYIYRSNRLIQWGGWSRIRTSDEHTKLARVSLDFSPVLDSAFGINISKALVKLPLDVRSELEPVVSQVAGIADKRYRKKAASGGSGGSRAGKKGSGSGHGAGSSANPHGGESPSISARPALEKAAKKAGEGAALSRIVSVLQQSEPEVARELGW